MRGRDFALVCLGIAAIYVPVSLFPAPDIRIFLLPWLRHIEQAGPIGAFAHPFSNYSPPYLYLLSLASLLRLPELATIKLVSLLGVFWLAWCVARFARTLDASPLGAAERTLLLPTVILNGPVLGQCDTIWTGCCILAVTEAMKSRPWRMAIWAGAAFAFKAQAAFLAPFCIGYMIQKRAWFTVLVPPAIYVIAIAPAALAGWPILDLLTIYLRQPQFTFIGDAPNIWAVPAALGVPGPAIFPIGYFLGAVGFVFVASVRRRDFLLVALLSALLVPFLLPKMLERFFFLADVLSLAIAYARKDRVSIILATLIQAGSFLSITAYLADWRWLNAIAFVFTASAVILVSFALFREREPAPRMNASSKATGAV